MLRHVQVNLLPSFVDASRLAGKTAIVIDVLRATTTIAHALAHGAAEVIPCLEVDEARRLAAQRRAAGDSPGVVLGGERGGLPIEGFDLGNSPADYSADRVRGKTVIFTTTNGTRAMQICREARRVLIAAFVNFSAVCSAIDGEEQLEIVCAGTDGGVTREDVLLAGALVDDILRSSGGDEVQLNDEAEIAMDAWNAAARDFESLKPLAEVLRASRGGRNLIEIGHERDIDIAAQIDTLETAPELDLPRWRILDPHRAVS